MKREIKFRGKRIDNGEWAYGYYLFSGLVHYIAEHSKAMHDDKGSVTNLTKVHPDTVGQFTGLKDKNGKEIYEGDKLTYDSHDTANFASDENKKKWTTEVEWRYSVWYLTDGTYSYTKPFNTIDESSANRIEVIGTIHDEEQK